MTSEKGTNQNAEVKSIRGAPPPPPPPAAVPTSLTAELARCLTELVASTPNQRNWRGILIALVVIGCVCGLIIFSVILLTPPDTGPRFSGTRFTLADVLSGAFNAQGFRGKWISGTEVVFADESGGVSLLFVPTLIVTPLVSNFTFRRLNVEEFDVSPDKRYILLKHDVLQPHSFRHLAKYTVLQMDTEHVESVTPFPSREGHPSLQHAAWIPGADSALVLVHSNDIYVKESPTSPVVTRITSTGVPHVIFNGVTDYLYREYVMHSVSAVWASGEGTRLCYGTFNDTEVSEVTIPVYTGTYPTLTHIRYPKVDSTNPVVTLYVVDMPTTSNSSPSESPVPAKDLKPPSRVKDQDHYITGVAWVDEDTVAVVWRNRAQNISVITSCTEPLWYCDELFIEESGPTRWAIVEDVPLFGKNGTAFLTVAPLVDGTLGTYPHVHQGAKDTKHAIPLTFGPYTVFSIIAWDTENHHVYYVANSETESSERHLWRVTDVGSDTPRQQDCLTCHLNYTTPICKHFTPHFGPDNFNEVVLECEGPGVPHTILYSLVNEDILITLHNSSRLHALASEMAWPQRKNYRVNLERDFVAQVRLSLPPEFSEEEAFIHPVILKVGGHPGEHVINHKWGVDWSTYLASNKSWVVVEVEVRGGAGQDLGLVYKPGWRLGEYEARDALQITRSLLDQLEFLDGSRVAAVGWGHSGHNTARLTAQDTAEPQTITCTALINPIADWALYASYYSEKYMGTARVVPGGNYRGYEESSLLLQAASFKNRSLMLVHGTADMDVHPDHSLRFTRALTKNNILFRQQTYADEGHSLDRVEMHLYRTVEQYLESCFPPYTEEELSLMFGKDVLP